MTYQDRAIALRAPSLSPFGPSPQAVSSVPVSIDYRDRLLDAQLSAIRLQGMARRAAWALQGLCDQAAEQGIDVTYTRTLANDIERRAGAEVIA